MDTPTASMPGYRINEYRLVIPLSEDLQEKITSLRTRLHEKHKVKLPFEIPPSLTILKCNAFEKTEPRLIERMQYIAMGTNPFKVELDGFAAYPSHTIYINVPTRNPFAELVKELKKMKWLMNIQGHEPHFIPEPHLIIAQQLKPMQFINMWLESEHSNFSGRFISDSLLLLRRGEADRHYKPFKKLEFLSLPSAIKQGSLFAG
jgi:2'-5' RNA ligase